MRIALDNTMSDTPLALARHGTATGPGQDITPAQVQQALAHLLASPEFCKAQRMRRLIRFLVEKLLAGAVRDTAEYAIGIEVFDRDALHYCTGEDPTVRVQVGRLRERLRAYYAGSGAQADLHFSIPIGSYMPVISRIGGSDSFAHGHLLAIKPLADFTRHTEGATFTHGVNEELSYQLFRAFGHKIVSYTFAGIDPPMSGGQTGGAGVSHLLEGSVRASSDLIRISLRLVDASAGCIAWSEQFDRCVPFSISLQEELALAICAALKLYFEQG